ncbi:hypothetical protein DRO26_04420 [Candidatus Bathyarchaeota archaeon]|nr:MAG: hypothetical protein DRO26_04420 [Candidatus Bathyarchaeota archaeon]
MILKKWVKIKLSFLRVGFWVRNIKFFGFKLIMRFTGLGSVLVVSVMGFFVYLGVFMRVPLVPLYARNMGASLVQVGFITSAFMAVASLLAIPSGLMSDRFGRKFMVVMGAFISSISSFLLAFSTNPNFLIFIYAFAGLGVAAFSPTVIAFVGDVSKTESLGLAYGLYTTIMATAMASGPSVGGLSAELFGYQNTFIWSGLVILVGVFVGFLAFPSKFDGRRRTETYWKDISSDFRKVAGNNLIFACWVAAFCLSFGWGVAPAFLPLYGRKIGLGVVLVGLLFTVQSASSAASRFPFGVLLDKVHGGKFFVVLGLGVLGLSTAMLTFFTDLTVLMGLMGLIGFAMGMAFVSLSSLIAEATDYVTRGLAMGVYSACFYGGMSVSPALLGSFITLYGYQFGFGIAALLCFVGILVFSSLTFRFKA